MHLVPWPKKRSLLVLGYPDVYEAADHVVAVLRVGPHRVWKGSTIVLVDDMQKKGIHPRDAKLLPDGKGWLMVEFGGDDKTEADAQARALMAELAAQPNAPTMKLFDERGRGAAALEGARVGPRRDRVRARPEADAWEGWEDSAVPPAQRRRLPARAPRAASRTTAITPRSTATSARAASIRASTSICTPPTASSTLARVHGRGRRPRRQATAARCPASTATASRAASSCPSMFGHELVRGVPRVQGDLGSATAR